MPGYVASAVQEHQSTLAGIIPSRPTAGSVGTPDIPKAVEEKVRNLAGQYEANKKKFENGQMSRDDFYNSASDLQMQVDQATASISERPRGSIESAKPTSSAKDSIGNMSLFQLADMVTGPGASIKSTVSSIPGLGAAFPETTQARAFTEVAINGIVSALRTTERFGNMEREEIKADLGITPSILQDGQKLKNKLVGVATFIEQERDKAARLAKRTDVNVDVSIKAEALLQDMEKALQILNPPPKVFTVEEAMRLPIGTEFRWNGTELKTRKRGANER